MSTIKVGLRIEGDAKGATAAIEAAEREVDGLGQAGQEASRDLAEMGTAGREAGRSTSEGASLGQRALAGLQDAALEVAAGLAAAAAAAAGLGRASQLARELETGMARVSTLLSDTSGIDQLTDSVRALSREFGGSAASQATALADVIGAGFEDAAQSVEILRQANILAVGGFTDVTVAADGLTTVMNAFGPSVGSAQSVADSFFQTALAGKTTVDQLASSIGSAAPIAAQAGVSFDQLMAAVSTLTRGGVQTSVAFDGMRAIIAAVLKPSAEAADLAEQLGLEFNGAALKAGDLAGFLEQLRIKTGGSAEQMSVLLGGVEALAPALTLTGTGAAGFARDIEGAANKAGKAAGAFATVAETGEQQLARLRAAFESELTDVGQLLNTALAPAVVFLTDNMGLISDGLTLAAQAALVFAGIKGLAAIPIAAGAVSTALAATIVQLQLVTPLWAWATGTMTGATAAMTGLRSAGGALLAMIGGWPTVIAAATVGLGLLIRQLMTAQEQAQAAAEETRRQYDQMWQRYAQAQQMFRAQRPEVIGADIAAQEALIARMTGRFSEQSVAMQSARERLVELRAEYVRAGGQLTGLTGTTTAATAAANKFNQDLRDQAQRLREQIAQARGGAAAVAELRLSQVDMSKATQQQRDEAQKLTAEIRALEGQLKATTGATSGRAAATRDGAAADLQATAALQAHADAMDALKQASGEFEQLERRVADALATPAERAQREYEEALAVVDNFQAALMSLGPIDPATFDSLGRLREDLKQVRDQATTGGEQIVDSAAEQSQQWAESWDSGAGQVMQSIERWAYNGFRGLGDSLSDMMRDIRAQLVAMFARPLVIPIMAALGMGGSGMAMGGQGGLLQSLMGQGGLFGGGTPLGGSIGNFGGGLAAAGANIGGAGFFGSMGANLSQGFAAIGSGSLAAGIGQVIPVIGQVYAVLQGIDAITGGRIFGRGFQTTGMTETLSIGAGGATATATEQQRRRGSLFGGGSRRRSVDRDVDPAVQADADAYWSSVNAAMRAAADAMQSEVAPVISGAIRQITEVDSKGRVTATRIMVDVLGRTWEESTMEAARSRFASEALISQIDASLGTTAQAAAQAIGDATAEGIEGAAGGIGAAFGDSLSDTFGEGVATMLKGATSAVQGEASAIAERWRTDAATLADGAQMLLLAATDIRRGTGLLGDGSLTAVADLIEDMAVDGESLAAAYARVSASTQLFEQALDLSGLTLDRTREEFVRLAAGITEAAGGLDRAQQLWNAFYQGFFTEQERALLAQQRALTAANREFGDIGRNVSDFQGEAGIAEFRRQFNEILKTGSAEAIVQWLEAAEALGILNAATAQLGSGASLAAQTIADFMAGIDADLARLAPEAGLVEQLEAQRAQNAELVARAQELGASEAELARVRQLGDARIQQIIGSVSQQTATLTGSLRRLGITLSGSAEDIAVLASQMSGDFDSLFEEFLGSFYSETEQGAQRLSVAQANLSAALQAAGLASDELISREQLRAQIEAALAAGNIQLAESLLRVASAMNAVDAAAGNAAGSVGGQGNNGNGSQFGSGGGSGLGFGGEGGGSGSIGGAGNDLAQTIADIQRGLREWLAALTAGDLSPLRPRDQLQQQRAELARLVAAAQAGDIDAMRQLSGAGDAVLRLGQQVLRGAAYRALFDEVRRMVGGVAGVGVTPIGGGSGGVGTRPGDDLGDLGRSAMSAAAALDLLAARAGMPPGSLTTFAPPRPLPQFGGVASDQAFGEASSRPVVTELQRGRAAAAEENARLRAEIAELSAQMRELRVAADRQAEQLARANDYERARGM